jgi:hypothetical protein
MLDLSAAKTALILADLQQGIVSRPSLAPRSGAEVAATGAKLAERFRAAGNVRSGFRRRAEATSRHAIFPSRGRLAIEL